MGQGISCSSSLAAAAVGKERNGVSKAVRTGDLETLRSALEEDPALLNRTCSNPYYDRHSLLHIAASSGQIDVLSWLLDQSMNPDLLNRRKQTPLMLAAKHGKLSCVQKLIDAGANILMFDSRNGRTCLHYAAYYGHSRCLESIISAARSSDVALSWGFARFVNLKDGKGATPLHLAARQRRPDCVHTLLDNGALPCASTGCYGYPGSSPLHLAARAGSHDCIRELLAWGADRRQRDLSGRIPYMVALKHKHNTCAALLNPSSAEPLVWPSPLKFISELNPQAKYLLESALMDANREREKKTLKLKETTAAYDTSVIDSSDSLSDDDDNISEISESELCCICFDQVCTIEIQDCGHRMCAHCTLALCCHNKPNPTTSVVNLPLCPFCRSGIAGLDVVARTAEVDKDMDVRLKSRRSRNASEGGGGSCSNSFMGLSSFSILSNGRIGSGGIIVQDGEFIDKLES